jgi:hypothetical protein
MPAGVLIGYAGRGSYHGAWWRGPHSKAVSAAPAALRFVCHTASLPAALREHVV